MPSQGILRLFLDLEPTSVPPMMPSAPSVDGPNLYVNSVIYSLFVSNRHDTTLCTGSIDGPLGDQYNVVSARKMPTSVDFVYLFRNNCPNANQNKVNIFGLSPVTGQVTLDYSWEYKHSSSPVTNNKAASYFDGLSWTVFIQPSPEVIGSESGSITLNLEAGKPFGFILFFSNNDRRYFLPSWGRFRLFLDLESGTSHPSMVSSFGPSIQASEHPSLEPSDQPSELPSSVPSEQPSGQPSCVPSEQPSSQPSSQPSGQPSSNPSEPPSGQPSSNPSEAPSGQPSSHPSSQPSTQPSFQPSDAPSANPSQGCENVRSDVRDCQIDSNL